MNDQQPTRRKSWARRVADWWQRSPRVPAVLKSRRLAVQAFRDLVVAVLRSPSRFVGAVVRGLAVAVRWWRSWVRVADYRAAAERSEKLADEFTDIRALVLFRWKVTDALLWITAVVVAVLDLVYGHRVLWIGGGVVAMGLAVLGRQRRFTGS